MGPTWGPSGADSTQVGPMLAPWTLLSGKACNLSLSKTILLMSLLSCILPAMFKLLWWFCENYHTPNDIEITSYNQDIDFNIQTFYNFMFELVFNQNTLVRTATQPCIKIHALLYVLYKHFKASWFLWQLLCISHCHFVLTHLFLIYVKFLFTTRILYIYISADSIF